LLFDDANLVGEAAPAKIVQEAIKRIRMLAQGFPAMLLDKIVGYDCEQLLPDTFIELDEIFGLPVFNRKRKIHFPAFHYANDIRCGSRHPARSFKN
jgi:hypothetical protein